MTIDPDGGVDGDRLESLVAEALALQESGDAAALAAFQARQPPPMAARIRSVLARLQHLPVFGDTTTITGFPPRFGDFRLLRRIGGGGMGVVFLAEQESLRRHVAVKVIRADLLELAGMRERFRREVEAIARMQHPGIVPVLAVGEQDGLPFFAMEFVAGRTAAEAVGALQSRDPATLRGSDLQAALGDAGPATQDGAAATAFLGMWPEACVRVAIQVAEAIAHAHRQGIVHRDLKPSNVMLTVAGRALVLDFGLAHVRGSAKLTRTGGSGGGSPLYMSPEQILAEAIDERTDIYSLGVMLYELLALVPPFPATDPERLRLAVLAGDCRPLRQLNRTVSRDLAVVVHRAMDRDRQHRYRDMQGFAADLLRVLQREPVLAAPPGPGRRLLRFGRRHRVASAALLTALFAAAMVPPLLWLSQRESNRLMAAAKDRAERHFARSLDTIDQLLAHVGSDRLLQVPGMEQVRTDLLTEASDCYRRLLAEEADSPELHFRYATCLGELALAHEQLSHVDQAEQLWRQTLAELQRQDPADPRFAALRLRTELGIGRLLHSQQRANEGRGRVEAAIQELEVWCARQPDDIPWLEDLAMGYSVLAHLEQGQRRNEASFAASNRALEITRRIASKRPASVTARRRVADYCLNQAIGESEAGRTAAALTLVDEAIDILRRLPDEGDVLPNRSTTLARALGNRALMVGGEDACQLMAEALTLLEQQVRDFPKTAEKLFELAAMEHNHGLILMQLDRTAESVVMFERARTHELAFLQQQPNHRDGTRFLANHLGKLLGLLAQLERHDEMVRAAEDLLLVPGPEPVLEAAGAVAYCAAKADGAAAAALRRRCFELLQEAARRGRVPAAMLQHPNFATVANDPEFAAVRTLLVKPEAGEAPGAAAPADPPRK